MTTITTRSGKGIPLTNAEVDVNFTNLNEYKVEKDSPTGAAQLPSGSTAQRPTGVAGLLRYNATTNSFEGYTSDWGPIGGATGVFPFYKSDGTSDPINLTADSKFPFYKASGTASNIPMTV